MYAEVAWVLVSLGTQGQPQIRLDLDYLLDYFSVSYDYVKIQMTFLSFVNLYVVQISEQVNLYL